MRGQPGGQGPFLEVRPDKETAGEEGLQPPLSQTLPGVRLDRVVHLSQQLSDR